MRPSLSLWLVLAVSAAAQAHAGDPPVALKGLDPVTLVEGKEVTGTEGIESTRDRFRYRFADAEHKARFDADPARYAAQGPMCTVMPKVPASPDLYLVHDARIYLFGSPGCRTRFQADPATFLKARAMKKVAILVFDGMELLDFAGPGEVFATAGQGRAFEVFTVAATTAPIRSQGFVAIEPRYSFADCPKPDILVVPGGATRTSQEDAAVLNWVRKTSVGAEVTLSVCTGSLILARAGLLDGLEATTHHQSLAALGEAAPKAMVREGRRFVDNGRIVTSAGISAGIDASLHLVSRLLGPAAASEAAATMEYRWADGASSGSR